MAYRYLVDYIKMIIKDRIAPGQYKFMALAFLKEVTKTNDPTLANYLDVKILKRLYQLTIAPEGERCLTIYDKKVNLADSARFHYLLRECFTNWGSKFKAVNKNYMVYTQKLAKRKLVPAPEEKYWNFPDGVAREEPLRGDSIINDFSADNMRNDSQLDGSNISRSRSNSPNVQRSPNAPASSAYGGSSPMNSQTNVQTSGAQNPVRDLTRAALQRLQTAARAHRPENPDFGQPVRQAGPPNRRRTARL